WQQLQAFTAQRNLPIASLIMFKPAFASMTLTVVETKRLKLGRGVDGHFFGKASRSGKPMGTLESVNQQLSFLDQLNEVDADKLLTATMRELNALPNNAAAVRSAWRNGDMPAHDKLVGAKMRAQAPDLYQALVSDRNQKWLLKIEAMLHTPELEYLLLDAMHLAGPDSLLRMLEQKGFTVSPYKI